MKKNQKQTEAAAELRRRAEARLNEQRKSSEAGQPGTAKDTARLVHELQVHQIELEMRNEELKASHAKVEAGRALYAELYDFAPTGYLTFDREGAIRLVNLTGARLLGTELSRLANRRFGQFVAEGDRRAFSDFLEKIFASEAKESCEVTLSREGSQSLTVQIEGTRSADGQECRAVMLDVTGRKRAELRIQHLVRLYAMLSQVNQAVVRSKEREELFRTICQVAVDSGKFGLAWIGLIDRETGDVTSAAVHGAAHDRLPFQKMNYREMPCRDGLLGKAVSSGNIVYTRDIQADPTMQHWHEAALAGNYHAAAVAPFRLNGEVIGLLVLFATEADFFAEEEQDKLLTETALDISFALEGMEKERERQEAEQQMQLQSAALEAAANAIVITDLKGDILWVNAAFTTFTGYTPEEIVGKNPRILKSGKQDEHFYRDLWQTIRSGQVWQGEIVNRRKDGSFYTQEMTITPVRDRRGEVARFITINQDITERKRAERERQRLVALVENSPDFVSMAELDGRMVYLNAAGRRLVGLRTEEELKGKTIFEFLTAEDLPRHQTEILPTVRQSDRWQGEVRLRDCQTGRPVPVAMDAFVFSDPETGQPVALGAICRDLTEKKSLERQFLRTQRLESLGNLASGIAHDLNNILAPILMSAQILQLSEPEEDAENMLATIVGSAHRGADIIKQVLTFARGVEGERIPVQPKFLVKEMEKIFRETFPKNITFRFEAPKGLWRITGDATQLHQVLMNLCVNARDAMPNGGTLVLSAENVQITKTRSDLFANAKPGPHVLIRVSDTGEGIPPAIMERIFDPFFTTKEQGKGTGLGLSTVLGIVRSHGGFVDVESEPGRGSTFKVYLPAQPAEETEHLHRASVASPTGTGEWVLVVDDEANIRDMTRAILNKRGYEVLLAANGKEALELLSARADQVKAVITDIVMPVMDGMALVRAMKQSYPQILVIACSGWGQEDLQAQLRALGVNTFLEKPYGAEKLLAALHEHLTATL